MSTKTKATGASRDRVDHWAQSFTGDGVRIVVEVAVQWGRETWPVIWLVS